MQLTVLGNRVGAPLGAPCSGYLVEGGGATVLLDCGPGVAAPLWAGGHLERLDAIFLSHAHADHLWDVPMLASSVAQDCLDRRSPGRPRTRLVVPVGRGRRVLEGLLEVLGWGAEALDRAFEVQEYGFQDVVRIERLRVTFSRTAHPEPCAAIRVSDGERTLVYGADGRATPDLVEHCRGADLAVLESTYVDPDPGIARFGHMTGEQAAGVARDAGAARLALTHVQPFDEDVEENLRRADAVLPGRVALAEPGATFAV